MSAKKQTEGQKMAVPTPKNVQKDYKRGMASIGGGGKVDAGQKTGMRSPQG